jgi:hypothetical protein
MSFSGSSAWSARRDAATTGFRWGLIAAAGLFGLLSCLLVLRRIVGAFDQAFGGSTLVAIVTATLLGVTAVRIALKNLIDVNSVVRWAPDAFLTFCLLCFSFSLSLPGSPAWSLFVVWLGVVAAETAWWLHRGGMRIPIGLRLRLAQRDRLPLSAATATETLPIDSGESDVLDANVTQRFTRAIEPNGNDVLHGIVRSDFTTGERLRQVHIAICPPMGHSPQLNAFQVDGPTATIKTAQAESFGIRLEVRLAGLPKEPVRVTIEFVAESARQTQASDSTAE